jgi:hypothetical protein
VGFSPGRASYLRREIRAGFAENYLPSAHNRNEDDLPAPRLTPSPFHFFSGKSPSKIIFLAHFT